MPVSAAARVSGRQMPASVGVAGTGGEQDGGGVQRHRRLNVDLVVADDARLGPELAEIVEEVVGEAVVIVDQQQHFPGPFQEGFRLAPRGHRAIHGPGAGTGSRGSGRLAAGPRTESGEVMQRGTYGFWRGVLTGLVVTLVAVLALAWVFPPLRAPEVDDAMQVAPAPPGAPRRRRRRGRC